MARGERVDLSKCVLKSKFKTEVFNCQFEIRVKPDRLNNALLTKLVMRCCIVICVPGSIQNVQVVQQIREPAVVHLNKVEHRGPQTLNRNEPLDKIDEKLAQHSGSGVNFTSGTLVKKYGSKIGWGAYIVAQNEQLDARCDAAREQNETQGYLEKPVLGCGRISRIYKWVILFLEIHS